MNIVDTKKVEEGQTKEQHLDSLQESLNKHVNQIKHNDEQIKQLENRLSQVEIQTKGAYKIIRKYNQGMGKFICANNRLKGLALAIQYSIKRNELATQVKMDRLTAEQLFEYIKYIEDTSDGTSVPFDFKVVNHINASTRRWLHKRNKLAYFNNIKLPNASGPKKMYWTLRTNKLAKDIEYYEDYIKDLKSSFASKFHAKLIRRLERVVHDKRITKQMESECLIDLRDVCKYYSNGTLAIKVLKDVNLQIDAGEFVVILGPSGSGKTTLLNIISGMDTATYGITVVNNVNLISMTQAQLTNFRRDNIGYVFQQYGLLPNLTVRENVEIGANLQTDKEKRIDIDDLLRTVGIYEHRNKFPHELSGGQQQRVSIARSVAKNPSLIFGDEPTGAVDEEMSKQIMQLFVDVNKKYKTTIIIVTHNIILSGLATKVIKVHNGRIDKVILNDHPKKVLDLD
jgi:putative ABC transport system ATP-binding protein